MTVSIVNKSAVSQATDPMAFFRWANDAETADRFYEWLDKVCDMAAQASDPCLVMSERRKGDRGLLALTTPKHILDMVDFISYWMPKDVYKRLRREANTAVACEGGSVSENS